MLQKARTLNTHVIFRKGTGNWELGTGRWHVAEEPCAHLQGRVPLRSYAECFPHAPSNPPGIQPQQGGHETSPSPSNFFLNNPASSLHLHPVSWRLRCATPQAVKRAVGRLAAALSRSLGGARTGGNEKGCSELTSLRRLCFLSPIIKGLAAPGLDSDFRGNPSRLFLPWPSIAPSIVQEK